MTREDVNWVLGTILSTLALLGLVVRFVLMPYIRENLVKPVQETKHQVTVNGHGSEKPTTVLDHMSDLRAEVLALRHDLTNEIAETRREVRADVARVEGKVDHHLLQHIDRRQGG